VKTCSGDHCSEKLGKVGELEMGQGSQEIDEKLAKGQRDVLILENRIS